VFVHEQKRYTIYFGGEKDLLFHPDSPSFTRDSFFNLRRRLRLKHLMFLKQVHGTRVVYADHAHFASEDVVLFQQQGDALVTNKRSVGIGILTADCLPVLLYDERHHAIASAHAGWRGAVARVLPRTLAAMKDTFGSLPEDISVYFGPSARQCCYEVTSEFLPPLGDAADRYVVRRKDRYFFDLSGMNREQLKTAFISPDRINEEYNTCTICDRRLNSFRRDGQRAGRQAAIAILH